MLPDTVPGSFVKYEKMGEDSGAVGAAAGIGSANAYIVTEKVHGANFCIIASFPPDAPDTPVVRFAKRTAILGSVADAEDFYSARSCGLLRDLAPCGEAVLRRFVAGSMGESVCAVHIYGELFGGSYAHPDVPSVPGIEPVQVGVWYSPDLCFMAFDVALETSEGRAYVNFDLARDACRQCGLLFAEPLLRGSLADCLNFDIEFETTVPARLGLPSLAAVSSERNLAEGVVVRPQTEPTACAGKVRVGKESTRGIFKRKIQQFSEKRYQNDDWKKGKCGGGGKDSFTVSTEELTGIEVFALVNEQRLAAVQSKIGRVDPKDKLACRELLESLKQDVREALDASDLDVLSASSKLEAELDDMCRVLITQQLLGAMRQR